MEVTAAERTTIYTNISPLAQRVNNYIQTQHSSIAAVAKDIGYSRTTVSRYLTGKYDSNPNDLESKLTDFLTRQTGEAVDLTTPLAESEGKTWQTPVFFESRDAKAVLGVCQSCQEYIGLGIVVARSGYGKTYALRQYAKLSRVAYIECDDTMSSRDLVEAIERSIGLPNGYGTIWCRVNGIREFFNTNKGYLLIIDEADKLVSKYTQKKMEILRAVFDQSDVGLVIAGEPKLEAQIKTYLVRMANRVDFYASLRGLSPSEVEGYLTDFQIEPEALVELKARACNMQTGCFRLLDRTLSNVRRILKETGEETVTVKTIAYAYTIDDADGDTLTVVEELNDETIRTINNAPKGEELTVTITSEKLYALGLNSVNTLKITVTDGKGGTAYRRVTFKRTNSAPTISGQDKALGLKNGSFAENYTVSDVEGDNVVVTEFVDDVQIRSYQATLGQQETIELTREKWLSLTNGQHQLRIEAVDGNFATSVRVFSFGKKETVIKFELVAPEETDAAATKVLVTPTWKIEGAVAKVEACNNGFDAVPTWEDITAMVQINRVYNFTNKTKTASKWGVNIRFTITKNEGFEGEVSISGFGGAYE